MRTFKKFERRLLTIMKTRSGLLVASIVAVAVLFVSAGIYAAAGAPDDIKMENKAYAKHKKGIVTFSHKKHSEDYAKTNKDFHLFYL